MLIVCKYLPSRLDDPNLSPESATAPGSMSRPGFAYLNFVIVNVGFGLILDRFSLKEDLDVLEGALERRRKGVCYHFAGPW